MNYYNPSHKPDEACEDFLLWRRRFSLASWFFLGFSIFSALAGRPIKAVLIGLGASFFWFLAESILTAKHIKWHLDNNDVHQ